MKSHHTSTLPTDWRLFHLENVRSIADREKVLAAVEFLKRHFPADVAARLKDIAQADPEWWAEHHFFGMMAVRNDLRTAKFGETDLGIDNLDDYAVGLVELALGVTTL